MAIFGRNKEEEEFEEFEEEKRFRKKEEREDHKLNKKFKDLAPKNKKKRKEPPKPWGLKERILVLSLLVITTLCAAVFAFSAKENKLPNIPRISFNFSGFDIGNPFGEKTIELGQPGHYKSDDEKAKEAIELFGAETKPVAGVYGFYVVRLSDQTSYGVSDNEKFQGASLLKLPLLVLLYKKADEGSINLDTKYILKNSDKVAGSGPLDSAKAGSVYTYRQLAEFMGKESDRTAYKIIKNILGDTGFNNFLNEAEMVNTSIVTGETTPRDMGGILQKLYSGKIVSDASRDEIFSYLTDTIYEKWITKGVPTGIGVVHKFGQDLGIMADAGIIMTSKPYVLVVMSKGITQADADKVFPAISKDVYEVETGVK